DRDRQTAKTYDGLGLPECFALEGFVQWRGECPRPPTAGRLAAGVFDSDVPLDSRPMIRLEGRNAPATEMRGVTYERFTKAGVELSAAVGPGRGGSRPADRTEDAP